MLLLSFPGKASNEVVLHERQHNCTIMLLHLNSMSMHTMRMYKDMHNVR